jgi:hypothetical protein
VPLIFKFKLFAISRLDQDGDGIPSYLEDLNGDGYMKSFRVILCSMSPMHYNTDRDGTFLDVDDDADGIGTREITAADGTIIPLQ